MKSFLLPAIVLITILSLLCIFITCVAVDANHFPDAQMQSLGWGWELSRGSVVGVYIPDLNQELSKPDLLGLETAQSLTLGVKSFQNITAESIIASMPQLQNVHVYRSPILCNGVTMQEYSRLLSLNGLNTLEIESLDSGDQNQDLPKCQSLRVLKLRLEHGTRVAPLITGLRLKELHLHVADGEQLNADALSAIANVATLDHLSIVVDRFNSWASINLEILARLPSLSSLELQSISFDPTHLRLLSRLRSLRLCHCKYSSVSPSVMFPHPFLSHISLELQPLTDLPFNDGILPERNELKTLEIKYPKLQEISVFSDIGCDVSVTIGNRPRPLQICYHADDLQDGHLLRKCGVHEIGELAGIERLSRLEICGDVVVADSALTSLADFERLRALTISPTCENEEPFVASAKESSVIFYLSLKTDVTEKSGVLHLLENEGIEVFSYSLPDTLTRGKILRKLPRLRSLTLNGVGIALMGRAIAPAWGIWEDSAVSRWASAEGRFETAAL